MQRAGETVKMWDVIKLNNNWIFHRLLFNCCASVCAPFRPAVPCSPPQNLIIEITCYLCLFAATNLHKFKVHEVRRALSNLFIRHKVPKLYINRLTMSKLINIVSTETEKMMMKMANTLFKYLMQFWQIPVERQTLIFCLTTSWVKPEREGRKETHNWNICDVWKVFMVGWVYYCFMSYFPSCFSSFLPCTAEKIWIFTINNSICSVPAGFQNISNLITHLMDRHNPKHSAPTFKLHY